MIKSEYNADKALKILHNFCMMTSETSLSPKTNSSNTQYVTTNLL